MQGTFAFRYESRFLTLPRAESPGILASMPHSLAAQVLRVTPRAFNVSEYPSATTALQMHFSSVSNASVKCLVQSTRHHSFAFRILPAAGLVRQNGQFQLSKNCGRSIRKDPRMPEIKLPVIPTAPERLSIPNPEGRGLPAQVG
jgi:hypothetical protein